MKLLTTDPVRDQFGPAYSPDGKHLAYFTNFKGTENESIGLADADGSNAVQLVQDARINIFRIGPRTAHIWSTCLGLLLPGNRNFAVYP